MTEKPTEQSKQDAQKKPAEDDLIKAVSLVNAAIRAEEQMYRKIASSEEQPPIMIEGTTATNHACQLMVDPKDVARIILEYDYPTWHVLGEEAPEGMWEDLGRFYGLKDVDSFDM